MALFLLPRLYNTEWEDGDELHRKDERNQLPPTILNLGL
jgi:hypothetical protein